MSNYIGYYKSPLGAIKVEADETALLSVVFMPNETLENGTRGSLLIEEAINQLREYFEGTRKVFDLPLAYEGTDFQKKVWQELIQIPYGQVISYTQLAKRLGSVKLIRAAGTANGKNPIGIIIPCHRVIGNGGELVGYAGGLWRKQWLLEHEGSKRLLPI